MRLSFCALVSCVGCLAWTDSADAGPLRRAGSCGAAYSAPAACAPAGFAAASCGSAGGRFVGRERTVVRGRFFHRGVSANDACAPPQFHAAPTVVPAAVPVPVPASPKAEKPPESVVVTAQYAASDPCPSVQYARPASACAGGSCGTAAGVTRGRFLFRSRW